MIDAKRKAMIFLTIAFILSVVTSVLVLNEVRSAQDSLGERTSVAVAASNIQPYSEINADMIEWVEIPQADGFTSFIRDLSDVQDAVTIVQLKEGDLLTHNILRSAADIPQDHRIVWLNATPNVVMDQAVAAGDTVDIVVTYTSEETDLTTTRVFENVEVIQRDQGSEETANIKISLHINDAEQFIHFQNTADSIRVLLANQIQQTEDIPAEESESSEQGESAEADEETPDEENNNDNNENDENNDNSDEENNDNNDEEKDDDEDNEDNEDEDDEGEDEE